MTGAQGAGQDAVGGVGGAMAATSRPASIKAEAVNPNTMMTDRQQGLKSFGDGLSGFGDLMGKLGSNSPAPISMPGSGHLRSTPVASYALPDAGNPFGSNSNSLDPNLLKALMAQRG